MGSEASKGARSLRLFTMLVAATLLIGAGTAWACPFQSAAKDQTLASSERAPSTPIPAKSQQDRKG